MAGVGTRSSLVALITLTAAAVTTPVSSADRRQRVEIAGLSFSMILPPGWSGASIPEHPTASDIERLQRDHPTAAAILQSPLARLFRFRFVANPPIVTGRFTPNLNVLVQTIPEGDSLRDFFFSGNSASAQYLGTTESVQVGSLHAIHYWSTKIQKYGTTPLLTDIVMVQRARLAYEFTFTALAGDQSRLQPIFDASEASIASG